MFANCALSVVMEEKGIEMPRGMKVVLFAAGSSVTLLLFVAKFIETQSVTSALLFVAQVWGMSLVILLVTVFFMWIGSRIFRE